MTGEMIDFNKGKFSISTYGGSEPKTKIDICGISYMVKYPDPVREAKNELSYMNNNYSEYIGCLIFRSCGIDAQSVALGYVNDNKGTSKVVVGCVDFTKEKGILHEFRKLANEVLVDTTKDKRGLSIENIVEVVSNHPYIQNKDEIISCFWDVFVVDALIGNADRHFDNWGVCSKDGNVSFAPVYDCGSSLSALVGDKEMRSAINDDKLFRNKEFNTFSCYRMNGKKIFYHEIFKDPPDSLKSSILKIIPSIDLDAIKDIISNTPTMSDIRKSYLIKALELRYSEILLPSLKRQVSKLKAGNRDSYMNLINDAKYNQSNKNSHSALHPNVSKNSNINDRFSL